MSDCCGFGSGFGGAGGATPEGGVIVEDDGTPISADPSSTLNFTGGGVTATDAGSGVATINIPGITFLEDGVAVAGAPHTSANFTGDGVSLTDDGAGVVGISIPGNVYAPPEQWVRNNVPANQLVNADLSALVSQNFNTIKTIRPGSIVGLATRLTEPITAGQLLVFVTLNGVPVLQILHTNASNQSGGVATQAVGVETYVAGELIGVGFTTDVGFLPITTDLEAWIQLFEAV